MNISLYILSSKPEKFYVKARKEYEKRLGRYCKLTVKEFKNKEKMSKAFAPDQTVIFVDETGRQMSSEKLAEAISAAEVGGISKVTVVVGYPYEERVFDNAERLAVSRMSLSADLLSTVVLEQIYRAYKIINGETYHK
ncbi:MAG: 23S rRNA (pseudouridine(1915)-N(3))-methyltransferase RlmH [Firmicutes bacterium]|nr:23S rRNA (pseudouridine(1915)-N(3))-methyltransferase RlmH [Clostridiales bacterium]MBQ2846587.1 23S rRNA (pseudouridine(1915)-N(3))-methyltransferase RlmH [Bacillota bacterium]MBQ4339438.1 23S rRNA (pseudouridine(1915)-N(3))-methyltransferase RlmH [Bacillota bacterium]